MNGGLVLTCYKCGANTNLENQFCGSCGANLKPPSMSKSSNSGCFTGVLGLIIGLSPAVFGPMQVAAQCGSNASESTCGAYMWPVWFVITLPIGLVLGIIGIVSSSKSKK